uniref:Uncharacterized protein n=1 Tax=Ananas comosus var. bracteatus TaxID=296719 RepID=A0A6V7PFH8_ANACO|nr:unnamed protein product [Ananas comosus var. bracteatus]
MWAFREATRAAWSAVDGGGSSAMDAVVAGCSACEELRCDGTDLIPEQYLSLWAQGKTSSPLRFNSVKCLFFCLNFYLTISFLVGILLIWFYRATHTVILVGDEEKEGMRWARIGLFMAEL